MSFPFSKNIQHIKLNMGSRRKQHIIVYFYLLLINNELIEQCIDDFLKFNLVD